MHLRLLLPLLALSSLAPTASEAQPWSLSDFKAERTRAEARTQFLEEERANIAARLAIPLGDREAAEERWGGAFWTAALINEPTPRVREALEEALVEFHDFSPAFQHVIMRSVYTLFPDDYVQEMAGALPHAREPRAFAIAAHYLLRHRTDDTTRLAIARAMIDNFPDWQEDGRFQYLWGFLTPGGLTAHNPPATDLFTHDFNGKPVVFSIQRMDRRHGGRAIVRDSSGRFLRDSETGEVFSVPQIALSRTNMPGTITYGNSPQGIYTIVGTGTARNPFIGPTPYLWSKVPHEATVAEFLHDPDRQGEAWTKEHYLDPLPESWRGYARFQEAWFAGVAGRSEMIAHGTTINPDFYRGESYYPFTPSAGCLTTYERWSPEDGTLAESGQVDLLNAFHQVSEDMTGYLVLVEIPGAGPIGADVIEAIARTVGR